MSEGPQPRCGSLIIQDAREQQEREARRDTEGPSKAGSQAQRSRESVCACAEPEFLLERALVPIFQFFLPVKFHHRQFCLPVLVLEEDTPCVGKGEGLATGAPTCSAALPALNAYAHRPTCRYLQSCPTSPGRMCVSTCRHRSTHTYPHWVTPTGVNTHVGTARNS